MSRQRQDPARARARRDRIRSEKHADPAGTPPARDPSLSPAPGRSFATERALRGVRALIEGQSFESTEDLNARLAELTRGGRISALANSWKQDDPNWRAQELAYDAMEADGPFEALRLVGEAQKLDPDCTDAQRLRVSLLPMELDNRIQLMRKVVDKAERNLGAAFFKENMGHFWEELSTRPYMRAEQHLATLLTAADRPEEAMVVYERMLELNPNDNQGIRYLLLSLHLAMKRPQAAGDLISSYPDEEEYSALFAWGRVLERWLSGQLADAESALERARNVNPFAEPYLAGTRRLPQKIPTSYRPGDDSEAQVTACELSEAWTRLPDFRKWLRARR